MVQSNRKWGVHIQWATSSTRLSPAPLYCLERLLAQSSSEQTIQYSAAEMAAMLSSPMQLVWELRTERECNNEPGAPWFVTFDSGYFNIPQALRKTSVKRQVSSISCAGSCLSPPPISYLPAPRHNVCRASGSWTHERQVWQWSEHRNLHWGHRLFHCRYCLLQFTPWDQPFRSLLSPASSIWC